MTNVDSLTMGRMCVHGGFHTVVAKYINDEATAATQRFGSTLSVNRHVAALQSLAQYVQAVGPGDQRLRALELCQPGGRGAYRPGRWQARFLGNVAGGAHPAMDNSEMLHELLGLAIEDLKSAHGVELERLQREAERLRADVGGAERARLAADEANERADHLQSALTQTQAELAKATETVEFFQTLHAEAEDEKARKGRRKRTVAA